MAKDHDKSLGDQHTFDGGAKRAESSNKLIWPPSRFSTWKTIPPGATRDVLGIKTCYAKPSTASKMRLSPFLCLLLLITSLLSIGSLGACVTSGSYEEELGHLTADQQFAKVKSLSVIGTGRMERPPTGLTRLIGWRRKTLLLKNAFFRERKMRW